MKIEFHPITIKTIVLISIATLLLRDLPIINNLFQPFRTFDFFLHELSHAIACLATGGTVKWMKLTGGGITDVHGGNEFIVGQAGYIGQAFLGSCLIFFANQKKSSNYILILIGLSIGLVNLFFLKDRGSITWACLTGAALVYAGFKAKEQWAQFIVLILAIQTTLYVFADVELLIEHSLGFVPSIHQSDATHMEQITGVPAYVWSLLWCVIAIIFLSIAFILRRQTINIARK